MAKSNGVWGIDIGQCGLKALRCTFDGEAVVADAFDYIEYPKILSQPEAEPEQLIAEALEQFLSRNHVKGDKVAMSVPGQSGLAKFFKPPPVDAKKIPDIVKYEARQQIPFALDDVIWDYQQMGGGSQVDGFALETEVGLFAMKRDQVFRAIRPLQNAGVELDIVQLAPLSIYNFVSYDLLTDLPAPEDFDPDRPPPSMVVLAMGTEATDLVVTNGFRVWQRSIPLGGNHFTKQLTKELKLTFAKAEHLKRNARQAEDPKTVFQAMRPIFNDLTTEIQRSLGYFQSIDRKAKIGGVVLLGNTVKLPGLKQYLAKNLGYEVVDFDSFSRLSGPAVVSSPAFKDNLLAFGVCYGLCLQGLGQASLNTNLIPREILTDRMIREKKPWALATVAALLLACTFHFFFNYRTWYKVHPERKVDGVAWVDTMQAVDRVKQESDRHTQTDTEKMNQLAHLTAIGEEVVGNADRRLLWLELLKAINDALPRDPDFRPGVIPDPQTKPFYERPELHIEYIESQYFPDLALWFDESVKTKYQQAQIRQPRGAGGAATDGDGQLPASQSEGQGPPAPPLTAGPPSGLGGSQDEEELEAPEGAGWVIEIRGYHYYNADQRAARAGTRMAPEGAVHVRQTLLRNLAEGSVELPSEPGKPPELFTMKELGIAYPLILSDQRIDREHTLPNPDFEGTAEGQAAGGEYGAGAFGAASGQAANPRGGNDAEHPPEFKAPKYSFTVQFCWQEQRLSERLERRRLEQLELERQQREEAEQEQRNVAANFDGGR